MVIAKKSRIASQAPIKNQDHGVIDCRIPVDATWALVSANTGAAASISSTMGSTTKSFAVPDITVAGLIISLSVSAISPVSPSVQANIFATDFFGEMIIFLFETL